jgi:hypothetical protein
MNNRHTISSHGRNNYTVQGLVSCAFNKTLSYSDFLSNIKANTMTVSDMTDTEACVEISASQNYDKDCNEQIQSNELYSKEAKTWPQMGWNTPPHDLLHVQVLNGLSCIRISPLEHCGYSSETCEFCHMSKLTIFTESANSLNWLPLCILNTLMKHVLLSYALQFLGHCHGVT